MGKDKDEYQLPEEEYGVDYESSENEGENAVFDDVAMTAPKKGISRFFSGKKIFIGVALLVVLAVIYEFVGGQDEEQQPQQQQAQQQVQQQPTQQVNVQAQQQRATKQQALQQQLDELSSASQRSSTNQAQLMQLQNNIVALQNYQGQLNNQISNINQGLQRLTMQVEMLSEKLRPKKKAPKKKVKLTKYYLRAVLPGRAWLQSSYGKSITVTMGDQLKGYGVITGINVEKGKVRTSSGKVIEYGTNDY